jgi:teichuronic acid biosynthesis glycosyltransferase TuaH
MSDKDLIYNCDIIMVGQQPWDTEIGSNCKNLALEFSKHNRVLYVNSPLDRGTRIKHLSDPAIQKRLDVVNKKIDGIEQVGPNLWVYYPDEIIESINWIKNEFIYTLFNKINNTRFAGSIQRAIKKLRFKNFILFNDNDIFRCFYLKKLLKPTISIYYSRDYLLTIDYWKLHGKVLEPKLIAKSDLCLANSVYLANYCKQYNNRSFYVGQGCDIDVFTGYKGNIPDDIAHIKKPIIGYVGALQNIRLDIELLKYIALQLPQYHIVLVGPEDNMFLASDLHQIENIHFLGNKPVDMMPAYINAFDVCLNPQIVNEVTIGNYPRKIDEYLAMGKPVIATQTEAMAAFKDHTYLCKTYDDYINYIQKALDEDGPELQAARIKFAQTHTWENNVKEIYKVIRSFKNDAEKTFLMLSNMRFNSPIEATSMFLARKMATNHKVYYIEYPLTYKDYIKEKGSADFINRKKSFFRAGEAVIDTEVSNLKRICLPFVISINFLPESKLYRFMLKINERIIVKRLKAVLGNEGIKNYIYINSFNFHYPDIGNSLNPALKVYQSLDPMITPYDIRHGILSETQLVKQSDVVLCSSKTLYNEKIKLNKNTWLVPNAGELSHSLKALDNNLPVHVKLKNIPGPIIGYVGSIERRIDYELLKDVITANTGKSFVFVGPVIKEHIPEWFFNTPNLYLPGQLPYDELPQMLKGFNIAIIPFKKDEVSSTIFPLKLFEYLGAGKPVISTCFNTDIKEYTGDVVSFCDDATSFNKAINNILANDNAIKQAERLAVARQNTWDIRSHEIVELIEEQLNKKLRF